MVLDIKVKLQVIIAFISITPTATHWVSCTFLACIKLLLSALYKTIVDYGNYVQIFEHVMNLFFLKNDLINMQTTKVP